MFTSLAEVSDHEISEVYFMSGIMLTQAANEAVILSFGSIAIYNIH